MPINTHPFTSEDVMAYLDGELPPATAAEMTAHFAQCRACQEVAADLQSVSRQISGWAVECPETDGMPLQITTELQARVAKHNTKQQHVLPWRWLTGHPWAVAASILLLTVVFFQTGRAPMEQKMASGVTARDVASDRFEPPKSQSIQFASVSEPSVNTAPAPLVVRTAELRLTVHTFDSVRTDLDRVLVQYGGHIAQLTVASPTNEARTLTATLRIPALQLDATLAQLRRLGRVDGESQRGEEVTQQSVDLEARLSNARHTEERLTQILATRTGKLSDVLEVEEKIAQVRGEIERAEAERKSLDNRVSFATVSLQVTEDYRTPLAGTIAPSVGTQLSNSATNGLHNAFDVIIAAIQLVLAAGPTVLLLAFVLGLPAYFLWKKFWHR